MEGTTADSKGRAEALHDSCLKLGPAAANAGAESETVEIDGCSLFMDVKGFNELFEPAAEIIYTLFGDVEKFMGDCLFAVFREPERAVTAGKLIQVLYAERLAGQSPFRARIGVNSGRAVRASVGSRSRSEYTYIGAAVNLARRLEAHCTPGRLLLAEAVFLEAAVDFSWTRRLELTVKGRRSPVAAYECAP
jgi:class 3 adenylate cyclase